MSFAELAITDGTTEVSLLRGDDGFFLKDWRPAIAQFKGSGVWQESPLADGRRLVNTQWDNTVESFVLVASGLDADEVILSLQNLRQLLQRGVEYWTSERQTSPVYLVARAACETNTRYAVVKSWSMPDDGNPYRQPFLNAEGSYMDELLLNVERGHWQSVAPESGECVQISAESSGLESQTFQPTGSTDDCYIIPALGSMGLTSTQCFAGADSTPNSRHSGMRFRNVTIPNGATIVQAFLRLTCSQSISNGDVILRIVGESNAAPAVFSTVADFTGRTLTAAEQSWRLLPPWTAGATYDSPDIKEVVQEIVNLGGWASGSDMVIFVRDKNSSNDAGNAAMRAWAQVDHAIYDQAQLIIISETSQVGRSETCAEETRVANFDAKAQLTHIFTDDGGVFSANLVGQTDYDLLPNPTAVNDAIYFGIDTTTDDSGPFCNLVFDIGTVAPAASGGTWEYWNGAGWVAFTTATACDSTSSTFSSGDGFEREGVNSFCWEVQAAWATTAVNGVTGYWVRWRVTVGGQTPPAQQNRAIYTANWPYVELTADEIGGDIPALSRVNYKVQSKQSGLNISVTAPLWANKLHVATRSVSRGVDFTPFINIADEQNPDGITITLVTSTAFANLVTTPTGRYALYNPAGVALFQDSVRIGFSSDLALQYSGIFRVFVRCRQVGGAVGELNLRGQTRTDTYVVEKTGDSSSPATTAQDWQLVDLGRWNLPVGAARVGERVDGFEFVIQAESTNGAPGDLRLYDVIFWPVDEWAIEAFDFSDDAQGFIGGDRTNKGQQRYLSIDSLAPIRTPLRATVRISDEALRYAWGYRSNGPAMLQTRQKQRLYFLALENDSTGSLTEEQLLAHPQIGASISVDKAQRYLSMRGSN